MSLALLTGLAAAATVTGVVRERGSGDPVSGAGVAVESLSVTATTASDGVFRLELPDGDWVLQVMGPLHAPEEASISVPAVGPLNVYLRPTAPPWEIVVESELESPHSARQVLDRERVEKTPGTHDDPIRLIQALPGVAMTPEYSPTGGAIALRGARPQDSRVFLDGVEIPYLYHFQQYASVVHTRLLEEVAVYPSVFAADYGDSTGGVVAVRSREADVQRVHGGATLNTIMGGAYVQAPVSDAVSVSASARRSYADLGEDSNDQYTQWPVFFDYLSRVDVDRDDGRHLAVALLGAGDAYGRFAADTASLDPFEQSQASDFKFGRGFHGFIGTAERATPSGQTNTTVGFTAERWQGRLADASQTRDEDALTIRHVRQWGWADWARVRAGGDLRGERTALLARTDRSWPELGLEAPLLARGQPIDARTLRSMGGVFVEPRFSASSFWLQPALRLQADSGIGRVGLEPRGSLSWDPLDSLRLRLAGGRYLQAPEPEALVQAPASDRLGWTKAVQAASGVDWTIDGRWEVAVDGWVRRVRDAAVLAPDQPLSVVDGAAMGVEFTSRYRIRDRFFSWWSVTLGQSTLGGSPSPFDQPYALSLVASWDFRPLWNAGFRWRYAAGLPITPVVDGVYDGDDDSYFPVYGQPYSQRMPDYQKLDFHIEREFRFRRWTLALYSEVWWVPRDNNILYRVYAFDYSEGDGVVGPPVLPLIGARAEF